MRNRYFHLHIYPALFNRDRKANESDVGAIYSIVNAAYAIELGNEGIAFKSVNRRVFILQVVARWSM